jgi:O-6-methylguanine DNA methyltransferase
MSIPKPATRLLHAAVPVSFGARACALRLVVDSADGALVACLPDAPDTLARIARAYPRATLADDTQGIAKAADELRAYAAGGLHAFSVPLRPAGSVFQQRVWAGLRAIPFGGRRTYGDIAASLGSPQAARAVGQACRANPILVFIPCHRVVGRTGAPLGYAGGQELLDCLRQLERGRATG